MPTEEILISYRVEVDQLKAELKQVQAQLKTTENTGKGAANNTSKEFSKAGNEIKQTLGSIAGAIGIAFGVAQVISFGKESIKAFAEAEVNANKLKFAVTQIGKEGKVAFDKLIEQSSKLQSISIFSDDDIQKAQTQLATLGLNSKQIEDLIPKVLDLASATGQDLGSATDNIIQGINGQTRSLRSVGLEFEATGDKTKNLSILSENLTKFQGSTAAALETTAGKTARLKNAYGDLQEVIGEFLVNEGNKFLDFFDVLTGKTALADAQTKLLSNKFLERFDLNDKALLERSQKSDKDKIIAEKILLKQIESNRALFEASQDKTNKQIIANRISEQEQLLKEIKKVNEEGGGLGGVAIDPAIAAKAKEEATKQAIELRDLQAAIIEDAKSKELAQLVNKFTDIREAHKGQKEFLLTLETSFQQERDSIIKKYSDKDLADSNIAFEEAIKIADEQMNAEMKLAIEGYNERKALRLKEVQDEKEKEAAIVKLKQEAASVGYDAARGFVDLLFSYQSQHRDEESKQNEEDKNKEIGDLDILLNKRIITQEQYNQKKKIIEDKARTQESALKKRAFEAQRNASLIQATIATAQGITTALTGDPYTVSARVALAAIIGATQIALIAAQPTPKFAKGGKVKGQLHSAGGTLIEAERDEWIIKRNESIKNDSLLDAINKGKGQKYIYEMYVAPALKEQLKKHNTGKDSDFASNIAGSMMLNSGNFKDGNILESLKMQRKADKENILYLAKVFSQKNNNARNW